MPKPRSIAELKAAIVEQLNGLDEQQLSLLFDIVEDLAPELGLGDHRNDPEFVAKMDRRVGDWKVGRNTISFDSVDEAMSCLRTA